MDCKEVKNKLANYVSGNCSNDEREEISIHLSECEECINELDKIEKETSNKSSMDNINKNLAKVSKKFKNKVFLMSISAAIATLITLGLVLPAIISIPTSFKMSKITRLSMDAVQFTQDRKVGGYGNKPFGFFDYTQSFSVYTSEVTGKKFKEQTEIKISPNIITGSFESIAPAVSQYIHPNIEPSKGYGEEYTLEKANNILIKNKDNTVATIRVSLQNVKALEEIKNILMDYDVEVQWLAVECGDEEIEPKNMSAGQNQYVQWGIPGTLASSKDSSLSFISIEDINYNKAIMGELKWLDENKKLIKADKGLLKYNGIDNSVGGKAAYIIDNGIKIYGLKITGPTSELLELQKELDIRFIEVLDMDFYYW